MVCRCCNKDGPCFDSGDCAPGYKCCVDEEGNGLCHIEPYDWSVSIPAVASEGTTITADVRHLGGCDSEEFFADIVNHETDSSDTQYSNVALSTQLSPDGTFKYSNFPITIVQDNLNEPTESFSVRLYRLVEGVQSLVAESGRCYIQGATWQVAPFFGNSVNEGSNMSFGVTTTNVPAGTTFWWRIAHVTTTNQDFTGPGGLPASTIPRGTGTINSSGSATFTIPVVYPDAFTEGNEIFKVEISTTQSGAAVATSSNVTINDTSLNPTGLLQCGTAAASGGIQFTQQYYAVSGGAGLIRVHYNVGNLADRFVFYAGGGSGELYDTGFITGQGTFSFSKPLGVRTIRVESEGQDANTRWCYTLMCPNDNSTPPLCDPFA